MPILFRLWSLPSLRRNRDDSRPPIPRPSLPRMRRNWYVFSLQGLSVRRRSGNGEGWRRFRRAVTERITLPVVGHDAESWVFRCPRNRHAPSFPEGRRPFPAPARSEAESRGVSPAAGWQRFWLKREVSPARTAKPRKDRRNVPFGRRRDQEGADEGTSGQAG